MTTGLIWGGSLLHTVHAAGFQPNLSGAEIAAATDLALVHDSATTGGEKLPNPGKLAKKPTALLTTQTLLVAIKEEKLNTPSSKRLAEVFLYNYQLQQTRYHLIDLADRTIVRSRSIATHHLPLNPEERHYARKLVANHDTLRQRLEAELQTVANAHFKDLQSKVVIYEPAAEQQGRAALCQHRRCAQLSYTTTQRFSLSLEPIVLMATAEIIAPDSAAQ